MTIHLEVQRLRVTTSPCSCPHPALLQSLPRFILGIHSVVPLRSARFCSRALGRRPMCLRFTGFRSVSSRYTRLGWNLSPSPGNIQVLLAAIKERPRCLAKVFTAHREVLSAGCKDGWKEGGSVCTLHLPLLLFIPRCTYGKGEKRQTGKYGELNLCNKAQTSEHCTSLRREHLAVGFWLGTSNKQSLLLIKFP